MKIEIQDSYKYISVVGKPENNSDYTTDKKTIRESEKKLLAEKTSIEPINQIFMDQVHGDKVIAIESYPEQDLQYIGEADAIVTSLKWLLLVVRTADCVPVFIHDPEKNVLAGVHAGWRGCHQELPAKTAYFMKKKYLSDIRRMKAFILPSIGPDSYEVGEDVAKFFPADSKPSGEKFRLDLWNNITNSLAEAGLRIENIHNSSICTLKHNSDFFSHRCKDQGRNLNFGYLK